MALRYLRLIRMLNGSTSGIRALATPLLVSLFVVPLPGVGVRAIPIFLIFWLLSDPKVRVRERDVMVFSIFALLGCTLMLAQPDKAVFVISLLLAILINQLLLSIPRHWSLVPTLWLHIIAALMSLATLLVYGSDLIPSLLYGESRHGIQADASLSFRISGVYQEPSTFGLHMLLLSIWADHTDPHRRWVGSLFAVLALLTFSSITILAALQIVLQLRKSMSSRAWILLVPLVLVTGGTIMLIFYRFFAQKILLYQSMGWETVKRFEALFFTIREIDAGRYNFFLGHPAEVIQQFVIYDLGPIISTLLILGFGGVVTIIIFLARMRFTLLNIAVIAATKATINSPLLWIATSRFPRRRNSRQSSSQDIDQCL